MLTNVNLQELVGGALQEQFAEAFEKVMLNMQDPNTPYKNRREITIKLAFAQNEQRNDVRCGVTVTEKLAPVSPLTTNFTVGMDVRNGQVYANEYGAGTVAGQLSMSELLPTPEIENGEPVFNFNNVEVLR